MSIPTSDLRADDYASWLTTVWDALHGFREDCIPEGDALFDAQWDELCTAMTWISEALQRQMDVEP